MATIFGPALNRVARLLAIGHGGQVLVSGATAVLVADDLPPTFELIDLGEHRLRDLDRPEHVYQLAAPGLRREFPPLRSMATHATNLPLQLTSFVGRERELADVRRLLAAVAWSRSSGWVAPARPGSCSRPQRPLVDRYRDGAWLVELAPISDPDLVVAGGRPRPRGPGTARTAARSTRSSTSCAPRTCCCSSTIASTSSAAAADAGPSPARRLSVPEACSRRAASRSASRARPSSPCRPWPCRGDRPA